MTRWLLVLTLGVLAGCASGSDTPPAEGQPTPWVTVTLANETGERVVEAALNPFDVVGHSQAALDVPLAAGAELELQVRAGTWSLSYTTESGREGSEPGLELRESRRIVLE